LHNGHRASGSPSLAARAVSYVFVHVMAAVHGNQEQVWRRFSALSGWGTSTSNPGCCHIPSKTDNWM